MGFVNLPPEIQSAIVSGTTGLVGAIIGVATALITAWLTKKIEAIGKISLFVRMAHSKDPNNQPCGCYESGTEFGLYMKLPLFLEIVNSSGIPRIIRNVNLYACSNKKEIVAFDSIRRIEDGEKSIALGNNGAYTYVIEPNCACQFDMEFYLIESLLNKENFDEIILSYYDEKNRYHAFHLIDVDFCGGEWIEGEMTVPGDWITLKKECKYGHHRETL